MIRVQPKSPDSAPTTVVRAGRALPDTPTRRPAVSTGLVSAALINRSEPVRTPLTQSVAPTQFFSQPVELPQPKEGADINVQVRHWACIYGPKYSEQQIKLAFENAKKLIDSGKVDFTSTNHLGCTAIHNAARTNNMPFIDYALNHSAYNIDIDAYNQVSNSTALSDLIASGFFKSAIELIEKHHANINVLVRGRIKDKTTGEYKENDTCSILLKALIKCLRGINDNGNNELLDNLIELLVKKGLQFFHTPESSCPASFELGEKEFPLDDEDKKRIKQFEINEKKYFKLYSIEILKNEYPKAFELFKTEWLNVQKDLHHTQNDEAQELWNIWQRAENIKVLDTLAPVSKPPLK